MGKSVAESPLGAPLGYPLIAGLPTYMGPLAGVEEGLTQEFPLERFLFETLVGVFYLCSPGNSSSGAPSGKPVFGMFSGRSLGPLRRRSFCV